MAVSVVVGLAVLEGAARLLVEPIDFLAPRLEGDPWLGHRIAPDSGAHDDWGFRNHQRPDTADVVAIGDSLTYGYMATAAGAWPSQLADLSGATVYNLGLADYGPLQYLHLLRTRAVALEPKHVVVGFYFGNDLANVHNLVYRRDAWADWRPGGADAPPPGERFGARTSWSKPFLWGLRRRLAANSVLYRAVTQSPLFDFVRDSEAAASAAAAAGAAARPAGQFTHDFKDFRTVLKPANVQQYMDPDDPRIAAALDVSIRALGEMARIADDHDIDLTVLLLPTKEYVLQPLLGDGLAAEKAALLDAAVASEDHLRDEITAALERFDIPVIDAVPPLRAAARRGREIFPAHDGHPNAEGYRVIAEAVHGYLNGAGE